MSVSERVRDLVARLHWNARLACEEVAWSEFLAVGAFVFTIGTEFWVNNPLRHELRGLHAHVTTVGNGSVPDEPRPPEPLPDTADFVAGLMAFLPKTDVREQQLQTLHSLCNESGVALSRVEYGHSQLEHLAGSRMTMQLAVSAAYGPYRKFLHDLLVAMPNLSIERVTMERSPGQADRLNIRLETSLYYRNADTGSAR